MQSKVIDRISAANSLSNVNQLIIFYILLGCNL
jgi:hypothetical protein